MKTPSDVSFSPFEYAVYIEHLIIHLFPNNDMAFVLQRASNDHQAFRLIMQVVIRDGGPNKLLDEYESENVLIQIVWADIIRCLVEKRNQSDFANEIAFQLNLDRFNLEMKNHLTTNQANLWKDLNSYRFWAKKGSKTYLTGLGFVIRNDNFFCGRNCQDILRDYLNDDFL